ASAPRRRAGGRIWHIGCFLAERALRAARNSRRTAMLPTARRGAAQSHRSLLARLPQARRTESPHAIHALLVPCLSLVGRSRLPSGVPRALRARGAHGRQG